MISKKDIFFVLIGLAIAGLGYRMQLEKFFYFPPIGDTQDEVKAPFNGINLLKNGKPKSWSWYSEYGDFPVLQIRNARYRLVEPWFEEPPLFSLMAGTYAKWKGINELEQVDAGVFRYPMIKFGALNIFLLFMIVYLLNKPAVAVAAALVYATVPTMVLGARLPLSDNMISTMMLLSLLGLVIYSKKGNRWALGLVGVVSAAAFLCKQPGIFVPVAAIFLLMAMRKFKAAIFVGACMGAAIIFWVWYGYHYGWELFMQILQSSSGRELFQPGNLISIFTAYRIGESIASTDGWLLWGWLAVVAYQFMGREKNEGVLQRLAMPVMIGSYLVFFSIMSGHIKGWYRFPFYPMLSWAGAEVVIGIIKNPRFLPSLFFLGVPLASSYIYGSGEYKFSVPEIRLFQYFFVTLTAPFMLNEIFPGKKLKLIAQGLLLVAFVAAIIFNVRTILYHQDQFWY